MSGISQISIDEAGLDDGTSLVVDIRDPQSYQRGHIEGAIHLSDDNLEEFLRTADKSRKTVVCCYHGNSSQGAAAYLQERGFTDVHSLIGGYEGWAHRR